MNLSLLARVWYSYPVSETQLVEKILHRDRQALSVFYRTYKPKLLRFIATKVENHADAEEILQDTLFAFLEAVRDFEGRSLLQTFLYSICQHKIVDFYRRKKIRHIVFSRIPQLEHLIIPLLSPDDGLDKAFMKEKVYSIFGKLLPNYRRVLIFKYLDQYTVAEIAQKLSISFKSAESQLFRARKAFVELFLSI
ncbi:RNA polymerase sigma factor [Candidatus Gottesmanbacteria bacterium]|nr:RNA polymerase sigma factor [Candidatus Gottesmanbacteria bacterium]